jgi:colanic acid/amylovoran biosynthesis glycosyltransferase
MEQRHLKLAYIVGTYPLLTTTFIDREIKALRDNGVNIQILSIRQPESGLSEEQLEIQQAVQYILPASLGEVVKGHAWFLFWRKPAVYLKTLAYLLTRPHPNFRARFKSILHFGSGVHAAYLLRNKHFDHLYAHFIDRAAVVALVASRLLGIPYSLSAHANDIYLNPVLLHEKLSGAKFVATCTRYNLSYLSGLAKNGTREKIRSIYHGIDVNKFQPAATVPEGKPLITAVGQLREKKGFYYLVNACCLLKDQGYDFKCQIIGAGPLQKTLESQISRLHLEDTVTLRGALLQEQVIEEYRRTSIFVLPCVTGSDGDRDGIPNVILEAMAMSIPVISTDHSGIPEAVEDGVNGLLVPTADEIALAGAMAKLIDDPDLRRRLGERGRNTVIKKFNLDRNAKSLLSEFSYS